MFAPFSWKGTLAQYCGRLHRNFEGKSEVVIYDYVDFRLPVFDRMYQKRLKGYKQLGYAIKPYAEDSFINTSDASSKLFSVEEYKSIFEKDIMNAKNKIIIGVPYFSKYETQNFLLYATNLIIKGVRI